MGFQMTANDRVALILGQQIMQIVLLQMEAEKTKAAADEAERLKTEVEALRSKVAEMLTAAGQTPNGA